MALSNWDTLAFDTKGKSSFGKKHWEGTGVEIYKNWLYIHSSNLWYEGCLYSKPIIAELWEGKLSIENLTIHAVRGPQNAIFVIVAKWDEETGEYEFFGGIGCSGYEDTVERILTSLGRGDEADTGFWSDTATDEGDGEGWVHSIENIETGESIVYHKDSKNGEYHTVWEGVKPETVEKFFTWAESIDKFGNYEEWLSLCKEGEKLRYNQGDNFFSNRTGILLPATKPGESVIPMVMKMLDKKK